MTKQYKKDYFKDRKLKYEKNHGVFIHEFMFSEFSNRILGQCNVALNDLQKQLDVEIARAKAEELRIETKAHNELGKIYNYINPSSSTYEDALNSQEPLKYTELAHVDGDFLAENGKKDLNSAYNKSMTVLMQEINVIKQNVGTTPQSLSDSYTVNNQGRLVKSENKAKLITNYNDSLMNIAQAINRLTERVTALENK